MLFQTDIGHAGEFIDSILAQRPETLAPPVVMSDALSSNQPTVGPTRQALCNAHARRQFNDLRETFPEIVEAVLTDYRKIWHHQSEAEEQGLGTVATQHYHQQHSLPVIEELKQRFEVALSDGSVEANSSLGKAMSYYLSYYEDLTAFCHIPGAAIDNNLMEAQLKLAVRNRKNAMFHKTQTGASVFDVVASLIATGMESGVNLFNYFNLVQREQA